jgi:hypothetical protein
MPYLAWNKASADTKRRYFELIRQGASGADASRCVGASFSCGSLWFIETGSVSFFDKPISSRYLTIEVNSPSSPVNETPSLRARSTSACAHARLASTSPRQPSRRKHLALAAPQVQQSLPCSSARSPLTRPTQREPSITPNTQRTGQTQKMETRLVG